RTLPKLALMTFVAAVSIFSAPFAVIVMLFTPASPFPSFTTRYAYFSPAGRLIATAPATVRLTIRTSSVSSTGASGETRTVRNAPTTFPAFFCAFWRRRPGCFSPAAVAASIASASTVSPTPAVTNRPWLSTVSCAWSAYAAPLSTRGKSSARMPTASPAAVTPPLTETPSIGSPAVSQFFAVVPVTYFIPRRSVTAALESISRMSSFCHFSWDIDSSCCRASGRKKIGGAVLWGGEKSRRERPLLGRRFGRGQMLRVGLLRIGAGEPHHMGVHSFRGFVIATLRAG